MLKEKTSAVPFEFFLRERMDAHGVSGDQYSIKLLWQLPGPESDYTDPKREDIAWLSCYQVNEVRVLVKTFTWDWDGHFYKVQLLDDLPNARWEPGTDTEELDALLRLPSVNSSPEFRFNYWLGLTSLVHGEEQDAKAIERFNRLNAEWQTKEIRRLDTLHDEQESWDAVSKKRKRNERQWIRNASGSVGGAITVIAAAALAHVPTETMWLVARYVGAIWLVISCFWFVAGLPLLIVCAIFDNRAQKARKNEGAEKTAARLARRVLWRSRPVAKVLGFVTGVAFQAVMVIGGAFIVSCWPSAADKLDRWALNDRPSTIEHCDANWKERPPIVSAEPAPTPSSHSGLKLLNGRVIHCIPSSNDDTRPPDMKMDDNKTILFYDKDTGQYHTR
jgi:hypothetical protein